MSSDVRATVCPECLQTIVKVKFQPPKILIGYSFSISSRDQCEQLNNDRLCGKTWFIYDSFCRLIVIIFLISVTNVINLSGLQRISLVHYCIIHADNGKKNKLVFIILIRPKSSKFSV